MVLLIGSVFIAAWNIAKHKIKNPRFAEDTYNYALIGPYAGRRDGVVRLALFDAAANTNVACPPLYPKLHYWFVEQWKLFTPLQIQSFFDCVAQLGLFALLTPLCGWQIAAAAVVIHNVTPTVFNETLYFTHRPWATLLYWCNISFVALYLAEAYPPYLAAAIATYAVLILSHKHSLQLLYFVYVVLSIVYWTPVFALIVGVGELLGVVISLGFSIDVHREHWQLCVFSYKYLFPADRRVGYNKDQLLLLRQTEVVQTVPSPLRVLRQELLGNCEYSLYLPAALYLMLALPEHTQAQVFAYMLVLTVIAACCTQWVYGLKFVGEGVRYLEYGALPLFAALTPTIVTQPWGKLHWVMAAYLVGWVLFAGRRCYNAWRTINANIVMNTDTEFDKLIAYVKDTNWDRFLVLPIQKAQPFCYLTGRHSLVFLGVGGFFQAKDWFPQIRRPVPTFIAEYGIRYVVLDERYVKPEELGLGEHPVAHRAGPYVILCATQEAPATGSNVEKSPVVVQSATPASETA